MNIIGHRKIFFAISIALIILSVSGIVFFGLRLGIDFTGGTLWQISIAPDDKKIPSSSDVGQFLSDIGLTNTSVYFEEATQSMVVRARVLTTGERAEYLSALNEKYDDAKELKLDTIGPSISGELRKKAVLGIILVLLLISLYITFAFRSVSYRVSSVKYGAITLLTLFHDVVITAGFYVFLTHFFGVQIDINTIVALLVVVGFSVHDTIVVFDRIRENLLLNKDKNVALGPLINTSINQIMSRSLNTSLTLSLVLAAMFFLGPASLKFFALTILVGTIVGAYSSIFVASPLLLSVNKEK